MSFGHREIQSMIVHDTLILIFNTRPRPRQVRQVTIRHWCSYRTTINFKRLRSLRNACAACRLRLSLTLVGSVCRERLQFEYRIRLPILIAFSFYLFIYFFSFGSLHVAQRTPVVKRVLRSIQAEATHTQAKELN